MTSEPLRHPFGDQETDLVRDMVSSLYETSPYQILRCCAFSIVSGGEGCDMCQFLWRTHPWFQALPIEVLRQLL